MKQLTQSDHFLCVLDEVLFYGFKFWSENDQPAFWTISLQSFFFQKLRALTLSCNEETLMSLKVLGL